MLKGWFAFTLMQSKKKALKNPYFMILWWILWKRMMHTFPLLHGVTLQFLVLMHYQLLMLVKVWQEWVGLEN